MIDRIFVTAVAVALIAVAASIARYYRVAMILILIGSGLIVYDRYGDFQRLWNGGQGDEAATPAELPGSHDGPVAWSKLFINGAGAAQPGKLLNIGTLGIMGTNISDHDITLEDAYFIGGVDGARLKAQIGRGGARYRIADAGPLPPGALFFVVSDPLGPKEGLSPNEFLDKWPIVSFVAKYNGITRQLDFNRHMVEGSLPKTP